MKVSVLEGAGAAEMEGKQNAPAWVCDCLSVGPWTERR